MVVYLLIGFGYYPKYKKAGTEATISWDVAGYYLYLPAILLHRDVKKLDFAELDRKKYNYAPFSDSYYPIDNGNNVMKYTIGMSVLYLPAFLVGHTAAFMLGYDLDGYSLPYQLTLMLYGFLMVFIGLYYLRKFLLIYFEDWIVTWTVLIIALCTNLLEYGAITNAMAHNYLFAGYSLLLWNSVGIFKSNRKRYYFGSAIIIGLMALARPTEAISILIPILFLLFAKRGNIFKYLKDNVKTIIISGFIIFLIGSIQLIYWKYVSGNAIQYSYQDQGFSWLHPHILDGLFSFRAGWLVYTPVMFLSILGILKLRKQNPEWFYPVAIFIPLFIYIAFAWDIWWYGGSLGQRTMVQVYPILALPLAALLQSSKDVFSKTIIFAFIGICGFLNMWMTHQAHHGGLIKVGEMTKPYYLAIVGRNKVDKEVNKLLDTRFIYTNPIHQELLLFVSNDEFCLNKDNQSIPPINLPLTSEEKFVRLYVDYEIKDIEPQMWRWTQMIITFKSNNGSKITNMLRMQRSNNVIGKNTSFLDSKVPKDAVELEAFLWHAESDKEICFSSLKIVSLK